MSNEIQYAYPRGKTLYAVVLNASGQIWNTTTSAFESPTNTDWTKYANSVTEIVASTGFYTGNFPTAITAAGTYPVTLYVRVSGTAASTDTPIATGAIDWSGTFEMTLADPHFRSLLRYVDGNYTYNPTTNVLTLSDLNGSTIMTATLTYDGNGNITGRTTTVV
jgi:hypothetical protein